MERWGKLMLNIDGDTRISRVFACAVVGSSLDNVVGQQLVALFLGKKNDVLGVRVGL